MNLLLAYVLLSLVTLAVCGFAIWKGGPGERATALLILGFVIAERLAHYFFPDQRQLISLAGDALTALSILFITLRFASPWLGGVMLFYAATFGLHSFYFVTDRPEDLFHYWANNFNFAGVHICLVVGTIYAWRQRLRDRRLAASAAPA